MGERNKRLEAAMMTMLQKKMANIVNDKRGRPEIT